MDLYLPSLIITTSIDKLKKKIIKDKIVKGIYTGYNLSSDIAAVLFKGYLGWNLFINPNSNDITCVLYFIIKNKKSILFLLNNSINEREINFIVKNS